MFSASQGSCKIFINFKIMNYLDPTLEQLIFFVKRKQELLKKPELHNTEDLEKLSTYFHDEAKLTSALNIINEFIEDMQDSDEKVK